eukprot:GHVH01013501.1.p1 GENE.GHVH01013501.1~~GHVH01013501.1.p1  ORF type:complete len:122 (-),score=14.29 GHVH01013501.1:289-654(-)
MMGEGRHRERTSGPNLHHRHKTVIDPSQTVHAEYHCTDQRSLTNGVTGRLGRPIESSISEDSSTSWLYAPMEDIETPGKPKRNGHRRSKPTSAAASHPDEATNVFSSKPLKLDKTTAENST